MKSERRGFNGDTDKAERGILAGNSKRNLLCDGIKLQNSARFVRDLRVSRAGLRRLRIKFEKFSRENQYSPLHQVSFSNLTQAKRAQSPSCTYQKPQSDSLF